MDTNKNATKIMILGLILLTIAGLIVVALKGFKVTLMFGKHESIELKVGKEINIDDIREICDEIFANKKYVLKELEVFGDSFQINIQSITDDEKTNLINKVNEKFDTEKTVDDLRINSISNKRIRDVVKPYIVPMLITFTISFVYIGIRYRKNNSIKLILNIIKKIILTEMIILSIIAITRIPVDNNVIYIIMIIPIIELICKMYNLEDKIEK